MADCVKFEVIIEVTMNICVLWNAELSCGS